MDNGIDFTGSGAAPINPKISTREDSQSGISSTQWSNIEEELGFRTSTIETIEVDGGVPSSFGGFPSINPSAIPKPKVLTAEVDPPKAPKEAKPVPNAPGAEVDLHLEFESFKPAQSPQKDNVDNGPDTQEMDSVLNPPQPQDERTQEVRPAPVFRAVRPVSLGTLSPGLHEVVQKWQTLKIMKACAAAGIAVHLILVGGAVAADIEIGSVAATALSYLVMCATGAAVYFTYRKRSFIPHGVVANKDGLTVTYSYITSLTNEKPGGLARETVEWADLGSVSVSASGEGKKPAKVRFELFKTLRAGRQSFELEVDSEFSPHTAVESIRTHSENWFALNAESIEANQSVAKRF